MRDFRKLRTYQLADALVLTVYDVTRAFPREELFGLTRQLRRAAVSVPTNIVEGSARPTTGDYLHFLNIAMGSSVETAYLVGLAGRVGMLDGPKADSLRERYFELSRRLQTQIAELRARAGAEALRKPNTSRNVRARPATS